MKQAHNLLILEETEGIIYGVLKKCNISHQHPYYDDLVQIGRITLYYTIDSYSIPLTTEEEQYAFRGYAYQKIYWRIVDELRKFQKQQGQDIAWDEITSLPVTYTQQGGFEDDICTLHLFESLLPILSKYERLFFIDTYFHDLSVTEISRKYAVSRNTVYRWRNNVSLKSITFFQK